MNDEEIDTFAVYLTKGQLTVIAAALTQVAVQVTTDPKLDPRQANEFLGMLKDIAGAMRTAVGK